MREIKFRGKDLDGVWRYGSLVNNVFFYADTKKGVPYIFDVQDVDYSCLADLEDGEGFYEVRPETIGQFVGLKDKNGKEIYEGDIINSTDYPFMDEGKTNYLGIVSCDTRDCIGEFFVMLFVTKDSKRRGISNFTNKSFYELEMKNVEVIGNIFNNKRMFRNSDKEIMEWYLED